MAGALDDVRALGGEAFDYLKLRWASLRLGVVERLSMAAAGIVGKVVGGLVSLAAVVFLMVALALWIGEMSGRPSLGFLISGGVLLLVGIVLFATGQRIFANGIVRFFVDLFFTDNDYRHGTKK